MSMPYYVAPEQIMKDRADYARKGIARGRALVALSYDQGILLCAENPSRTLHKVAEIYDRIAFAGVGKFSEFDSLRTAGIRHADLKGYSYSREDVDSRSLANAFAQLLGNVFTHEMKPMEVEILVAEVGWQLDVDQIFRISYDGTVVDEEHRTVLGGDADAISERLNGPPPTTPPSTWGRPCGGRSRPWPAPTAPSPPAELEVAILDRAQTHRAFRRLTQAELDPCSWPTAPA